MSTELANILTEKILTKHVEDTNRLNLIEIHFKAISHLLDELAIAEYENIPKTDLAASIANTRVVLKELEMLYGIPENIIDNYEELIIYRIGKEMGRNTDEK